MERLVLLDRDGTIVVEKNYLSSPADVALIPGAAVGIRRLRELGLKVAVVTNQSGIGRGYFDSAAAERVHARMRQLLALEGAELDGIYICPHRPDEGCLCRKPAAELARRAAADLHADLATAFVIGDKDCDIEMGRNVGAVSILVRTGYGAEVERHGACRPDHVTNDLAAAATLIQELIGA